MTVKKGETEKEVVELRDQQSFERTRRNKRRAHEESLAARFVLIRHTDPGGISGVGLVAWGCVFPNDMVALTWRDDQGQPAMTWETSIDAVIRKHGHEGATELIWFDGPRSALWDEQHERVSMEESGPNS